MAILRLLTVVGVLSDHYNEYSDSAKTHCSQNYLFVEAETVFVFMIGQCLNKNHKQERKHYTNVVSAEMQFISVWGAAEMQYISVWGAVQHVLAHLGNHYSMPPPHPHRVPSPIQSPYSGAQLERHWAGCPRLEGTPALSPAWSRPASTHSSPHRTRSLALATPLCSGVSTVTWAGWGLGTTSRAA